MKQLLLICCANHKNRFFEELPAREMYGGVLTRGGIRYAEENGMDAHILSAEYGFITPDTVIRRYTKRFTESQPYRGIFPDGEGLYLGGPAYFKNAPERFKPLLPPNLPLGKMTSALLGLLINRELPSVPRKQKVAGKTWYLYRWLVEAASSGGIVKEEAYFRLVEIFGEDELMRSTVNTQFSQCRVGEERGCFLRREGDRFWLEPKPGIMLSS